MRSLALILVVLFVTGCEPSSSSHVDANVPSAENFARLLHRDLAAYFSSQGSDVVSVEHEMLREVATQSGTAYPRFYVWVRATDQSGGLREGAARLAAIDKTKFEVTDYLTKESLLANPASMSAVFPQHVCEKIREKLK
jgi:hypothetical protein